MALSDRAQSFIMAIAFSMIPVSAYLATEPDIPRWVIIITGSIGMALAYIKESMGAKKAEVAERTET